MTTSNLTTAHMNYFAHHNIQVIEKSDPCAIENIGMVILLTAPSMAAIIGYNIDPGVINNFLNFITWAASLTMLGISFFALIFKSHLLSKIRDTSTSSNEKIKIIKRDFSIKDRFVKNDLFLWGKLNRTLATINICILIATGWLAIPLLWIILWSTLEFQKDFKIRAIKQFLKLISETSEASIIDGTCTTIENRLHISG